MLVYLPSYCKLTTVCNFIKYTLTAVSVSCQHCRSNGWVR